MFMIMLMSSFLLVKTKINFAVSPRTTVTSTREVLSNLGSQINNHITPKNYQRARLPFHKAQAFESNNLMILYLEEKGIEC